MYLDFCDGAAEDVEVGVEAGELVGLQREGEGAAKVGEVEICAQQAGHVEAEAIGLTRGVGEGGGTVHQLAADGGEVVAVVLLEAARAQ